MAFSTPEVPMATPTPDTVPSSFVRIPARLFDLPNPDQEVDVELSLAEADFDPTGTWIGSLDQIGYEAYFSICLSPKGGRPIIRSFSLRVENAGMLRSKPLVVGRGSHAVALQGYVAKYCFAQWRDAERARRDALEDGVDGEWTEDADAP